MCVTAALLSILLTLAASGGRCGVCGMRVSTAGRVEAVNGTDVRLKCTFQSSIPIKRSSLTISWSFRPLGSGNEESVFYYHMEPFLPSDGRFGRKVMWVGDISGRDASIVLRAVKFSYNGTYSCQVRNPPDVHGNAGQLQLRVVTSASFSEIVILAVAIGGAVLLIILFLVCMISLRRCRKTQRMERDSPFPPRERKDLMIW